MNNSNAKPGNHQIDARAIDTLQRARVPARWLLGLILFIGILGSLGATPAQKSYQNLERHLADIRKSSESSGPEIAKTWANFAQSLENALKRYSEASKSADRDSALDLLNKHVASLSASPWPPAITLRDDLREWIAPRQAIAQARSNLLIAAGARPDQAYDPEIPNPANPWLKFIKEGIEEPIRDLESAKTVDQRRVANAKLYLALANLRDSAMKNPWNPTFELMHACDRLYNQPNIRVSADLAALTPILENTLVKDGPVSRKGQVAYITAGPKTGFGLLSDPNGITFYNRQKLNSFTNVSGFEDQVKQNQGGRFLTRIYGLGMRTYGDSELTVYGRFTTNGLSLRSDSADNVDIQVQSTAKPHTALPRSAMSAIGFGQRDITQRIYDEALPRVRQEVPRESKEEREERMKAEEIKQNEQLKEYLVGGDTIVYSNFALTKSKISSEPHGAQFWTALQWRDAPRQTGADVAPPPQRITADPGLCVDAHLLSIANNLIQGYFAGPQLENIESWAVAGDLDNFKAADIKPEPNMTLEQFVEKAKELKEARKKDPKNRHFLARLTKPKTAPELEINSKGHLTVVARELTLEVCMPTAKLQIPGLNSLKTADYFRVTIPKLEVAISVTAQAEPANAVSVKGKVESVDVGTGVKITTFEGAKDPATLSALLTNLALPALTALAKDQEFQTSQTLPEIKAFRLVKISELDPSGWIRVQLLPTGERLFDPDAQQR